MGRVASKVLGSILRAAEVIFAAVVLVLEVLELHRLRKLEEDPPVSINKFDNVNIMTLTISATSVLVAALFIWGEHTFKYFVVDFIVAIAWFIIFGFQIAHFSREDCVQGADQVKELAFGGRCNERRAIWGFAFLSGFMWLGTFVIGLWVIWRERKLKSRKTTMTTMTVG